MHEHAPTTISGPPEAPWNAQEYRKDEQHLVTRDEESLSHDGSGGPPPGEDEAQDRFSSAASPARIVEGTIVESILLSSAESDEGQADPLLGWRPRRREPQAGFLIIAWALPITLVIVLLSAQFIPGLAGPLAHLVPGLLPTATVTIMPTSANLRVTSTITAVTGTPDERRSQVQARLVRVTTLSVAQTVPTTGKGHRPALHATGTVTFYNEASYEQTIATATILTGADGVRIRTDAPVVVPAGNPPRFGIVIVPAHAVQTGPAGNIAAYDVNSLCCAAGIAVKNTTVFTGGQNARDYPAVTQRDLESVASSLTLTLTKNAQDTFQAQVRPNEQETGSTRCTLTVRADHPVGSESSQVTVAVSVTCQGEVYDAQGAKRLAATQLAQQAMKQLGPGYSDIDGLITTITRVRSLDVHRGTFVVTVQAEGIWSYQFSADRLHAISRLIAGKSTGQAKARLLGMQGVRAVTIALTGGSSSLLPTNPDQIMVKLLIVVGL
jgi:hypothetical protein